MSRNKEQIIAACLLRGLVDALDQSAEQHISGIAYLFLFVVKAYGKKSVPPIQIGGSGSSHWFVGFLVGDRGR